MDEKEEEEEDEKEEDGRGGREVGVAREVDWGVGLQRRDSWCGHYRQAKVPVGAVQGKGWVDTCRFGG